MTRYRRLTAVAKVLLKSQGARDYHTRDLRRDTLTGKELIFFLSAFLAAMILIAVFVEH